MRCEMRDISQHEHTGADRINSVSSRVFIVQQQHRSEPNTGILLPKYDFSTAEKYGRLIVLLGPRCNAFNPQSVVPELRAKLADYSDADCLLLAGNPTLIGWAAAIAARANGGRLAVLQWERNKGGYIKILAELWA